MENDETGSFVIFNEWKCLAETARNVWDYCFGRNTVYTVSQLFYRQLWWKTKKKKVEKDHRVRVLSKSTFWWVYLISNHNHVSTHYFIKILYTYLHLIHNIYIFICFLGVKLVFFRSFSTKHFHNFLFYPTYKSTDAFIFLQSQTIILYIFFRVLSYGIYVHWVKIRLFVID